jgi:hypothetical protein
MTTIGGPGGIGGPKGPSGPEGPSEVPDLAGETVVGAPEAAARSSELDALAAEVAAGRLTPHEALDRLVEATAGPELAAADRAELRELLRDLVANDPFLGGLANRV